MEPVSSPLRACPYCNLSVLYLTISLSTRKEHYGHRGKVTETGPGSHTTGLPLPKNPAQILHIFERLLHSRTASMLEKNKVHCLDVLEFFLDLIGIIKYLCYLD